MITTAELKRVLVFLIFLINLYSYDLFQFISLRMMKSNLIPTQVILKKRRPNVLSDTTVNIDGSNNSIIKNTILSKTTTSTNTDTNTNEKHTPKFENADIISSANLVISVDVNTNTVPDSDLDFFLSQVEVANARGKYANINWKAIPMDDLRLHPYYRPLPEPMNTPIDSLKGFEDCAVFRQSSWQWDALHIGRLTTSRLASCLGFYENSAAECLDIPHGLRSHDRAVGAWNDLTRKAFSWRQFEALLIANNKSDVNDAPMSPTSSSRWSRISDATRAELPSFRCEYSPDRASGDQYPLLRYTTPHSARLAWGSAQEATAILAAINFFAHADDTIVVAESGMCTFEAAWSQCNSGGAVPRVYRQAHQWISEGSLPPLGASPDGLIVHSDGRTEVLEVKCSSPFISTGQQELMAISQRGPPESVGSWHIPQVQMEMFCAGSSCSSAVIIQLAVSGALVYRIARDDEYILQMLALSKEFYHKYVSSVKRNKLKPPPHNFFPPNGASSSASVKRYGDFFQRTAHIARTAELVGRLSAAQIQRSPIDSSFFFTTE